MPLTFHAPTHRRIISRTQTLLLISLSSGLAACGAPGSSETSSSEEEGTETEEGTTTGGDDAARPTSGTRLLAQYLEAEGGARVFERVFDSELDTVCTPGLADDGQIRCLPTYFMDVVYLDAQCSEPVFMGPAGEGFDFAYARTRSTSCDHVSNYASYRIDWDRSVPTQDIYRRGPEGCTAAQSADQPLFAVSEIPATDLVSLERRERSMAEGLVVISYDGADGSRLPGGYLDSGRSVPCVPSEVDGRCVPVELTSVWTDRYADEGCTQAVGEPIYGDATCAPQMLIDRGDTSDECALPAPRYFEAGELSSAVYELAGDACTSGVPGSVGVLVGAEVAPTTLPSIRAEVVDGSEVAELGYFDAEGERVGDAGLWIAAWGALCMLREGPGQQLYCGAQGAGIVVEPGNGIPVPWSNTDCTGTLLTDGRSCAGQGEAPLWNIISESWYERGPEFTGEGSMEFMGSCSPLPPMTGPLIEVGPLIPIAELPQLTRVDG